MRFLSSTHYQHVASSFSTYDPELWLPTLRVSVTPFMLGPWIVITGCTFCLTFWVCVVDEGLSEAFSLDPTGPVVLGSALSFLVVFRTNAAFERWWAARCAWSSIVDNCRCIAAMSGSALRDDATQAIATRRHASRCAPLPRLGFIRHTLNVFWYLARAAWHCSHMHALFSRTR